MPISPFLIAKAIQDQFKIREMRGKNISDISSSVGAAVSRILLTPNIVTCTTGGVAGITGVVNSTSLVGLIPQKMSAEMYHKARNKEVKGKVSSKFFEAIAHGVSQQLYTMRLLGNVFGCAVGTGVGTFNTLLKQSVLHSYLSQEMRNRKIIGRDAGNISEIISFGIVTHLLSSVKFNVIVAGAPFPIPPLGPIPVAGIPTVQTNLA